jgi:DNA-directed RNA polymerase specialized sigma24 family protein
MRLVHRNKIQEYTDDELLMKLKESVNGIEILYKRHKEYCINYMRSITNDFSSVNDIYHEAVIAFYEKLHTTDFALTCTIQTYLNSICRNQLFKRFNEAKKTQLDSYDDNLDHLDNIQDVLIEYDDVNSDRIRVMELVLKEWENEFKKCHEMLVRFWYKNQTMDKIAESMNFAHADSAKSQKAKCQKEFKSEVYKRLISAKNR